MIYEEVCNLPRCITVCNGLVGFLWGDKDGRLETALFPREEEITVMSLRGG